MSMSLDATSSHRPKLLSHELCSACNQNFFTPPESLNGSRLGPLMVSSCLMSHVFHHACFDRITENKPYHLIEKCPECVREVSSRVSSAASSSQGVSAAQARPAASPIHSLPSKMGIADRTYFFNKSTNTVYSETFWGKRIDNIIELSWSGNDIKLVNKSILKTYLICRDEKYYKYYLVDSETGLPHFIADDPGAIIERNGVKHQYLQNLPEPLNLDYIIINPKTGAPYKRQILTSEGILRAYDGNLDLVPRLLILETQQGIKIEPDEISSST